MITSMRVENFKGFERLELPDVARLTLIGGRNNVGKTSLLEAIFLFYDIGNPGLFLRHLAWRGIETSSAEPDVLVAPTFHDFDTGRDIHIAVKDDIYRAEMDVHFNPSYPKKSISIDLASMGNIPQVRTDPASFLSYSLDIHYRVDAFSDQTVSLVVKQSPTNLNIQFESAPTNVFPEAMRRGAIFLPLRTKIDPGEDAVRFGQVDIEKRSDKVLELLRILEPNLVGLSSVTLPQKSVLYADIGMPRKIPVAYMGDGMNRLLSLILAIATAKNGIVLVDEIDAGIHHSVMEKVWEGICGAVREFNCQLIATTHSYECVQMAHAGTLHAHASQEFRYVRLDRLDSGVVAKTYTHEVLGAALEHGWEVR